MERKDTDFGQFVEIQRLTNEERKADRDLALREQELALRRDELAVKLRELRLKEEDQRYSRWLNPIFLGLIAATLTLTGNILVTREQTKASLEQERTRNRNSLEQARAKAQSDLILEAIKTGNPSKAATNLDFFVNLGFINDPEGRIKKYLVNTGDVPVLPPASGTASANTGIFKSVQTLKGERRALSNSVGKLNGVSDEGLVLSCTAWIIAKDLIITADYCVSGMKGGLTFVLGDAPGMSLSTHSVELPPAELDAHAGFALLKVERSEEHTSELQ